MLEYFCPACKSIPKQTIDSPVSDVNNNEESASVKENKLSLKQGVPNSSNFDLRLDDDEHGENDDSHDHESKSTNLRNLKCEKHPQQKLTRH